MLQRQIATITRYKEWLSAVVLLLLLVGAGGGYRLLHRDSPSVVLRTTVLSGGGKFLAALDEWKSRLYIHTFGTTSLGNFGLDILDTRTGTLLHPTDIIAQSAGPLVNDRIPQAMIDAPVGTGVWIIDDRTFAPLLTSGDLDTFRTLWFVDDVTDTFYIIEQSGIIHIADIPSRHLHAPVLGCTRGPANVVVSHPMEHMFVPCADGTTEMRDARTGRFLRSINTAGLSPCMCRRIADDLTGRVFIPGDTALGVVDGRTGALLRTVPVGTWGNAYNVTPNAGGVIALDPRTGNVIVAPYVAAGSGSQAREVLVLNGRTGALMHRWPVPENPICVQANPRTGHLLIASAGPIDGNGNPIGNGTLSVLDMTHGTILQQIKVGILPGMIFADQRAGHLLVVNFTGPLTYHGTLTRMPSGGWWTQWLRVLKRKAGWLPFAAPVQPPPPTKVSVSLLDLTTL